MYATNVDILSQDELRTLRIKNNIDLLTADALYDFPDGTYRQFELGNLKPTILQDIRIRNTNPITVDGKSLLPTKYR